MAQKAYIGGRIPALLRSRINKVTSKTNQKDSSLLRASIEEFLIKNNTPEKVMAAVLGSVRRAAK